MVTKNSLAIKIKFDESSMAVLVYAKSLETGTNRAKFCCVSLILVYIHPHNPNFFFSQEAQTELHQISLNQLIKKVVDM